MFYALSWLQIQSSAQNYTRDSLNSFLYNYSFEKTPKPRTGKVYNVPLPLNLSGMEISVIRLRTRSLWRNGLNLSSIEIPPLILPRPFTKRVDIVYQNLGNLSSYYYNVQNYAFIAPVIGFLAYDSTNHGLVELKTGGNGNPIFVRFPNISFHGNVTRTCVRFDTNGTLEFSNVTEKSSCIARGQGHFSIVIPYEQKILEKKRKLKWWIIGIVAGVVGLILLGILAYKLFKRRKMRKMERQTERSEGLDTVWIGRSKMPSASGIRTQPVLENSYVP
ncbi:hypothetical protein BUALT_Bualt01G0235500 [Buddleja alternifolia]|uniref:Uncharacterized protein n=1 Tax=Buddleja alternifolia TaxID=168488 RepID=A0AAV6YAN3_9LAMI|nr:hypothetical protein BUALT_Bualt01G0235500 [Buddleja alternifolia]